MPKKLTTEEFIEKARKVHGDKYDYSETIYINSSKKVKIICKKHDEFWQMPGNHCHNQGCPKCAIENIKSSLMLGIQNFIEKANKIHNNKYDYSKVNYINNNTKVEIICKEHGSFFQTPCKHLEGRGCRKCGLIKLGNSLKNTKEDFIKRANEKHSNFYDYSKVDYIDTHTKVKIICPIHGEFLQTVSNHLLYGCDKCARNESSKKRSLGNEEFIKRALEVHKEDNFDYSKVNYVNSVIKVEIICPKHGSFWQSPHSHLDGNGCPKCRNYKGEIKIIAWLENHNIKYIHRHRFDDCISVRKLEFDFYIPSKNLCIEYDGVGHFEPINWRGKMTEEEMNENFENYKKRDKIKDEYCKNNNINLLRIPYTEFDNIDDILNDRLL